jgi:hypothetical protein
MRFEILPGVSRREINLMAGFLKKITIDLGRKRPFNIKNCMSKIQRYSE